MLPSQGDFLVRQEQCQDLLREAEKDRFIQAAGLRPFDKWGLPRQTANWLGTQVVKWGLHLQANRTPLPACCGDCCLVELKVNVSR